MRTLMSRWMTFCECMYSTAMSSWRRKKAASLSVSASSRTSRWKSSPPVALPSVKGHAHHTSDN